MHRHPTLTKAFAFIALSCLLVGPLVAADGGATPFPAPSELTEQAPATYRVEVTTTKGAFVIEVVREWAPHGADRFYNLVRNGFYDRAKFFRVIDDFMAQVGMHADPEVNAVWSQATFPDDPVVESNTRGMVSFAMRSQPNSRSTQFFVSVGDNSYLDEHRFAPFGRVVEGMDVVERLHAGYGEGAPRGNGPRQDRIAKEGNAYLDAEFPELDAIVSTKIVD